jgi:ribosomal protein S27AE
MTAFWPTAGIQGINATAANVEAARAAAGARRAEATVAEVEERLERLTLISMAMWEILRDNTKLTEADLMSKVQQIDLRDGVPDGKVTSKVQKCPKCERTMSTRHQVCLYCGHEKLIDSVFGSI